MKYSIRSGIGASGGFTLIEIMVVVVIIGLLAALVVPNVVGRDDQAKVAVVRSDLQSIGAALDTYKLDNFNYPSTDQGLLALIEQPSGFPEAKNWRQPYLRRKGVPQDPWGNDYVYIATDSGFELYSLGADGQEGGEGYAADIFLSEL